MRKNEAISQLMYTSRPILLGMCVDVWKNCVDTTNGSATSDHLSAFSQAQLVNWWITFFEWNEEESRWEDSCISATLH